MIQPTAGTWELVEFQQPQDDAYGGNFLIRAYDAPGGIAITIGGLGADERANAHLVLLAKDHALVARLLASGKMRWGALSDDLQKGNLWLKGVPYQTELDEFGVPRLTEALRAAIAREEKL